MRYKVDIRSDFLGNSGAAEDQSEPYCEQGHDSFSFSVDAIYPRHDPRASLITEIADDTYQHKSFPPFDDVPVGDPAYVVLASYVDGDTFGSSDYSFVAGVYATRETADECVRRCELKDSIRFEDRRPWDGYFADLNFVEIVELVMGK